MKWWSHPLGPGDIAQHLVRVSSREGARGYFIAHPGFTPAAIQQSREYLQRSVFLLGDLHELERIMTNRLELRSVLKEKIAAAVLHKNPYYCIAS